MTKIIPVHHPMLKQGPFYTPGLIRSYHNFKPVAIQATLLLRRLTITAMHLHATQMNFLTLKYQDVLRIQLAPLCSLSIPRHTYRRSTLHSTALQPDTLRLQCPPQHLHHRISLKIAIHLWMSTPLQLEQPFQTVTKILLLKGRQLCHKWPWGRQVESAPRLRVTIAGKPRQELKTWYDTW